MILQDSGRGNYNYGRDLTQGREVVKDEVLHIILEPLTEESGLRFLAVGFSVLQSQIK